MSEQEESRVVAMRVRDVHDGPAHVPSTMETCVECKEPVWVSLSSAPILAAGGKPLCTHCIPLGPHLFKVTDEVKAELRAQGITEKEIETVANFFARLHGGTYEQ